MEKNFGEFLKQKRLEKNLTQKQLAAILFVSESAISKWEKNIAHPDITLLPKLSTTLDVSEHEIITASIDKKTREERIQAKKWRTLIFSWHIFFYVSYIVALLPCFICNLAIDKTLSWFWIVFSALLLSFTFTNLPRLIKKYKLILLPLSMFLALSLLLATCAIYTKGDWFLLAVLPVLFALIIIFMPIYISKYKIFSKIKKYNDFVSIGICFIYLNFLLIVIDLYTVANNYAPNSWYFNIALPITCIVYLILNLFMSVRFLKLNKSLKTSIILFLINILYCVSALFFKSNNPIIQEEFESLNIFKANFSDWSIELPLARNIHFIIFLTILGLGIIFFVFGLFLNRKKKNEANK